MEDLMKFTLVCAAITTTGAAVDRRNGRDRASDGRREHTLGPVDNAWACEDRTAQPIMRKRYGAAYSGQRRVRAGFSIQPGRDGGRRICGPTAAELAQYGKRFAVRRGVRASEVKAVRGATRLGPLSG